METIRELLGRLTSLTSDELEDLRGKLVEEADRVDGEATTPESVALLNELADGVEAAMGESAAREEAQAQAEADKETARQRIAKAQGQGDEDENGDGEAEDGEGDGEEEPAEGEPAEAAADPVAEADTDDEEEAHEEVPEGEPVAASGSQLRRMARATRPAPSPERGGEAEPKPNRTVLTASGALRGLRDPMAPIEDREAFAKAMAETLTRMSERSAPRGDVLLASATYDYPQERRIDENMSSVAVSRVIDAICSPTALAATGGICLPVNVDYAVPTWATADRPLRDGLPGFQATRGGLRFVKPPDFPALEAATGIWTEATDAKPEGATKPIVSIACGAEELVYVEAISTRLGFGNMQSRFAPEQVAANTDLAIVAAARVAENNLLKLIEEVCLLDITSPILLGATRDFITVVEQATTAYRWRHRLPRSQTITAILPDWLKDLVKIDLARQLAVASGPGLDPLQVTEAQVESIIRAHGVNPIWHIDGQAEPGSKNYPLQGFGTQAKETAATAFPKKVAWYMFAEGMIQFLDGGRLDLGVVRDSTLDATNDYETFVETFETIAMRGFANGALQFVTELCANGGSAATISTAAKCA